MIPWQASNIVGYQYDGGVPRVKDGGRYECVYTHAGARAVIRAAAVPGPTILSPRAGDTVARTGMLTVTYAPGSGTGVAGEIHHGQGSSGGAYSGYSGQP